MILTKENAQQIVDVLNYIFTEDSVYQGKVYFEGFKAMLADNFNYPRVIIYKNDTSLVLPMGTKIDADEFLLKVPTEETKAGYAMARGIAGEVICFDINESIWLEISFSEMILHIVNDCMFDNSKIYLNK
jgi:hypothetical protein